MSICDLFFLLIGLVFYQLIFLSSVDALIPSVCVANVSAIGGSGVCCPTPEGISNKPCGGPGIGSCELQFIQLEGLPQVLLPDDRMMWPSRFFRHTCRCEGNFFGVACNECWYGWEGEGCTVRSDMVRRNIWSFSPEERRRFVNIVSRMPHTKVPFVLLLETDTAHSDPLTEPRFIEANLQYMIAFIHEYVSRGSMFKDKEMCDKLPKINNNHNVVGFNTWHRYLMLVWERELRKLASQMYGWDDFAIPYWDWIDAESCEVCTNDLVGAAGPLRGHKQYLHSASPFANWTEYCTTGENHDNCIGCHSEGLNFDKLNRRFKSFDFPTTEDLEFALSLKNYFVPGMKDHRAECREFHRALEGGCGRLDDKGTNMHNQVHNVVDGSFCCSPTASNDPIFILHHSQIDRIFQVWFEHYKPSPTEYPNHDVEPGSCRECNIIGFIPTVRHNQMFVDLRDLGIRYDNYDFGTKGFDGQAFIKYGSLYMSGGDGPLHPPHHLIDPSILD